MVFLTYWKYLDIDLDRQRATTERNRGYGAMSSDRCSRLEAASVLALPGRLSVVRAAETNETKMARL
jgi:hypothetical protein